MQTVVQCLAEEPILKEFITMFRNHITAIHIDTKFFVAEVYVHCVLADTTNVQSRLDVLYKLLRTPYTSGTYTHNDTMIYKNILKDYEREMDYQVSDTEAGNTFIRVHLLFGLSMELATKLQQIPVVVNALSELNECRPRLNEIRTCIDSVSQKEPKNRESIIFRSEPDTAYFGYTQHANFVKQGLLSALKDLGLTLTDSVQHNSIAVYTFEDDKEMVRCTVRRKSNIIHVGLFPKKGSN